MNATFLKHLGFILEEVVGRKLEDFLTVGSKIFYQTHFYPLIKIQKKADEIFLSFLAKDRTDIPVLLNVVLHQEEDNAFEIHCGGMQISRRNRFEKELLENKRTAQKALEGNEELIKIREKLVQTQQELELQLRSVTSKNIDQVELNKVLSHDLQEPLRKISLYSSKLILHENSDLNDHTIATLKKIAAFSLQVRTLLDSLQKFNSLDNKHVKISSVSLPQVMEKLKNSSEIKWENVALTFVDHTAAAIFKSDFKLVLDLLKALVNHALRSKKPALDVLEISITADTVSENVFTEIKDKYQYSNYLRIYFGTNGMADLDPETNVFELFKRSGEIVDESGIQLAYCRRIVQLLNGKIAVASEQKSGTVFSITLPYNESL